MKKEIKIEKTVNPKFDIVEQNIEQTKKDNDALCKMQRVHENTEKHGPLMAKFIEDGREAETEEIKEKVEKTMKEGMLSEEDVRTLQKMWEHSKIPLNEFLKRFEECLDEQDMAIYSYLPGRKIDWRNNIDDKEMLERTKKFLDFMYGKDFIYGKDEAQCKCKCQNEDNKSKHPKETLEAFDSPEKEEYVTPECEVKKDAGRLYFDGILDELKDLHARKNNDYGNAAHESYKEFGIVSYVIRLNDKMKRLKSLTDPNVEQKVADEKIEDTLMDLAAYAIMAIESLRS